MTEVDEIGPASEAGIIKGDVITMIDNQEVESVKDFESIASSLEAGRSVAMLVQRGDNTRFLTVTIPEATG